MKAPWVRCPECPVSVRYWHLDGHMQYWHEGPPPRKVPRADEFLPCATILDNDTRNQVDG